MQPVEKEFKQAANDAAVNNEVVMNEMFVGTRQNSQQIRRAVKREMFKRYTKQLMKNKKGKFARQVVRYNIRRLIQQSDIR